MMKYLPPPPTAFEREMERAFLPIHESVLLAKTAVYRCLDQAIQIACTHFDLPDPRVLPDGILTCTLRPLPACLERVGTRYELRYGGDDGALIAWGEEETIFTGTHFKVDARFAFTGWFRGEWMARGMDDDQLAVIRVA